MITSVVGCSVTETKPVIYNHQLNEVDFKQHHKREKIDGTIDYNVESKSSKIKRVYKYSNDFKLDECLKKSDIDLQSVLIILNENSKKELVKDNNTVHIEIYDNAEFTVEFSPCKIKEENKLYNYKITVKSNTLESSKTLAEINHNLENILLFPLTALVWCFYKLYVIITD